MKCTITLISLLFVISSDVYSADDEAQKQFNKDLKEVQKTYNRIKKEETAEQLRDKTHDYRLKIDKNTSLGVDASKNSVNVKGTF